MARIQAIRAPHGSTWFEADFSDGFRGRVPNRILRGYCPCAACQGHGGELAFRDGHDSDLLEIHPVGRYAVSLVWGDHHQSGIYAFDHVRRLCELYAEHGEELPTRVPSLTRSG
jgi:DUF971 family protein